MDSEFNTNMLHPLQTSKLFYPMPDHRPHLLLHCASLDKHTKAYILYEVLIEQQYYYTAWKKKNTTVTKWQITKQQEWQLQLSLQEHFHFSWCQYTTHNTQYIQHS